MLSKTLCVRCRNEFYKNSLKWSSLDDEHWDSGIIHCHSDFWEKGEIPSRKCPYRLEHIVETQEFPK